MINPPQDGDLAAAEISINYNNPKSTKDETKDPLYQLTWSGLDTGYVATGTPSSRSSSSPQPP